MDLESLWKFVITVGYTVRKNGCNGFEMWQPLKNYFSQYEISGFRDSFSPINQKIKQLAERVRYMAHDKNHQDVEIMIYNTRLNNSKETDHFIVQHFRIPMMSSSLPLVKILQLAYNIGQASAEFERGTYSEDIINFYKKNYLSDISTFIPSDLKNKSIVPK